MTAPEIKWPELKLVQEPFRHYVLLPQRIPIQWSVSSIATGRSDTKQLLNWAMKLVVKEFEDGDPKKAAKAHETELTYLGAFGTLVHDTIEANLRGYQHLPSDRPRPKELSEKDMVNADLSVASALTWLHNTGLEVFEIERKIAHSIQGKSLIWYAGTFDLLCRDCKGRYHLIDWKTSTGIRTKHFVQMGGYCEALAALGIEVHSITICRLPRAGGVDVATTTAVSAYRSLFVEELLLHQRYHDAKQHIQTCKAEEYVRQQEMGTQCPLCEAFCRYPTPNDQLEELCVQCHAKQIIDEKRKDEK